MSTPFFELPDPAPGRPFKRRYQPGTLHGALKGTLRMMGPYSEEGYRAAKQYGQDLWRKGTRHPRTIGLAAGAVALTLVGAYALSATGSSHSLCPAAKRPQFLLMMEPPSSAAAGSELKIHYDVCGLPSGTPFKGRIQLAQQKAGAKKSAQPKPLVIKFQDKVDGLSSRLDRRVALGSSKPGSYTLELTVVDDQGRVRKKAQKVQITSQ
jgi:hypothetical protein